jgi:dihydroorotase
LKNVPQSCYPLSYDKQRIYPEGYFADLTLVDLNSQWTVAKENLLYKWLVTIEGTTFTQSNADFVNGKLVYDHGEFHEDSFGMAIDFDI